MVDERQHQTGDVVEEEDQIDDSLEYQQHEREHRDDDDGRNYQIHDDQMRTQIDVELNYRIDDGLLLSRQTTTDGDQKQKTKKNQTDDGCCLGRPTDGDSKNPIGVDLNHRSDDDYDACVYLIH